MIPVGIFIVLLLFGFPFAFAVLITTTIGILIYSGTPLQIVIQQLYSGVNNYILLAIPFFIMSGSIAAKGDTSTYLIRVMRIFFGRIHGGSLNESSLRWQAGAGPAVHSGVQLSTGAL